MKRNSLFLCAACSAALLVVACATSMTRSESAAARAGDLRAAVAEVVADPARRSELMRSIDTMEATMLSAFEANARINREFAEASADPAVSLGRLQAIADQIAAARRVGLRNLMAARIGLRRGMTGDEWRAFASRLPAFDGGLQ